MIREQTENSTFSFSTLSKLMPETQAYFKDFEGLSHLSHKEFTKERPRMVKELKI